MCARGLSLSSLLNTKLGALRIAPRAESSTQAEEQVTFSRAAGSK